MMTKMGLGAVSVVDGKFKLKGLMTDGDVRRGLEKKRFSDAHHKRSDDTESFGNNC